MSQFLIVYNQSKGALVQIAEYPDSDRAMALEERFRLEHQYRGEPHIEVVLMGAASREDLEHTHARYFKTVAQLATDD